MLTARLLVVVVAAISSTPGPPPGMGAVSVVVSSPAFPAGSAIPSEYTCDGANSSPELDWTWIPDTAKSIAIVVDDSTVTHWLIWNVKPETRKLERGGNGGGVEGTNDFDRVGYSGPCPPNGAIRYYSFTVYGLDTDISLAPTATRADLDRLMNTHVVAQGTLFGTYQR